VLQGGGLCLGNGQAGATWIARAVVCSVGADDLEQPVLGLCRELAYAILSEPACKSCQHPPSDIHMVTDLAFMYSTAEDSQQVVCCELQALTAPLLPPLCWLC
jgi:hypothetical protein